MATVLASELNNIKWGSTREFRATANMTGDNVCST